MNWELIGVIVGGGAAVGTAAAAAFAAVQVRHLLRERRRERQLETDGVTVAWHNLEAPARIDDGPKTWKVEFAVLNPGRFPITDVRVEARFRSPVQRIHYDGSVDSPADRVELLHAVLAGGDARRWVRSFRTPAGVTPLAGCEAVVSFREVDGTRHENRWPHPSSGTAPASVD